MAPVWCKHTTTLRDERGKVFEKRPLKHIVADSGLPESEKPRGARHVLALLKPYLSWLVLLAFLSTGVGFLNGSSQVALTPLVELVLSLGQDVVPQASQGFTFDLKELGTSVLNLAMQATGVSDPWQLLLITSIVYLLFAVSGQMSGFVVRYWAMQLNYRIARDLEHRLFGHLLRLPLSFLNKHPIGWLQSRMTTDVQAAMDIISQILVDGVSNILLTVFYVIVLLRTNLRLTLVTALAGALHFGISRALGNIARRRTRTSFETTAHLQGFIQERLANAREIKALAGEAHEQAHFLAWISEQVRAVLRYQVLDRIDSPVRWSVNRVVIIVVMLFGAWELIGGRLTAAAFALFMFFAQSLIDPLAKLGSVLLRGRMVGALLEGVDYILNQSQERGGGRPVLPEGFHEALVLRDVSFAYEDGHMAVVHDLNLRIQKGEMVALVGRSGAGKTTLVDLILRFYQPTQGCITLDGVPVDSFELGAYRRLFGVVSQDSMLFNTSVYENIAYAHPELSRQEVEEAARIANAQDFILNELSEGYDTILGERGVRLSGGQRQRIAIARAVAHRPAILVLDEATSALDSESERQVQDAIARVVEGSTAIVIAHRLSTIYMADKIVVMKEGRIVEMGTHQELLERSGEYRYLHDLQFRSGELDPTESLS